MKQGKYLFICIALMLSIVITYVVLINSIYAGCSAIVVDDRTQPQNSIEFQEFVFLNINELRNFECKKKERAQFLFEQLSGLNKNVRYMHIQQNLFCARMVLYAMSRNKNLSSCNKQQFEIPCELGSLIGDNVLYKNALVQKISIQQLTKNNLAHKKLCTLSALEKLLE